MTVAVDSTNVVSDHTSYSAGSTTTSVTIASGDNLLMVAIGFVYNGSPAVPPDTVKYGGVSLTSLGGSGLFGNWDVSLWYLSAPTVGTANLVATWTTNTTGGQYCVTAVPISGAATSSIFGTVTTNSSNANNNPAVSPTGGVTGTLYLAATINGIQTTTASGTGQTSIAAVTTGGGQDSLAVSTIAGSGTGAFTWTGSGSLNSTNWIAVGVNINALALPAPTIVQNTAATAWPNGSNLTLSLTGVTAGNSILVASMIQAFQTSGTPTLSVNDGSAYTDLIQVYDQSHTTYYSIVDFALLQNVSAGTHSIVCTTTAGNTNNYGYSMAIELANLVTSPLDVSTSNTGTSANAITSGTTVAPQSTNEIAFAAFSMYNATLNLTPLEPSGFTNLLSNGASGTNISTCSLDYVTPVALSAQSAAWGSIANNGWAAAILTLSGTQLVAISPPFYSRKNVLFFI